jgi:hypothetical protein
MREKLRPPSGHALVGYLALFVALGGTSYAAVKPGGDGSPASSAPAHTAAAAPRIPAAVGGTDATPPTGQKSTVVETRIRTRRKGRLFVHGAVENASFPCQNGQACSVAIGIYVDGRPVAQTRRDGTGSCFVFPPNPPTCTPAFFFNATMFGLSRKVRAGGHTVTISFQTQSGQASMDPNRKAEVGAIGTG